jgi:hypothetical protein
MMNEPSKAPQTKIAEIAAELVAKIINLPPDRQRLALEDIAEKFRPAVALATLDALEAAKAKAAEIKSPSLAPLNPATVPAAPPTKPASLRRMLPGDENSPRWRNGVFIEAEEWAAMQASTAKPIPSPARRELPPGAPADGAGIAVAIPSTAVPEALSPEEPAVEEQPSAAKAAPAEPEVEPSSAVQLPAVIPPRPVAKYDAAIEMLNTQHAIIDNVGGKTVIASWEPSSLDPSKLVVVFQTKESFLLRYSNRFVTIDSPDGRGGFASRSQPMGAYWLGHRGRRQYRGVTFMPGGPEADEGCLNLWQRWGVDPSPGDWSLIREHIEGIVADGNEEFADYVIRWIAWSIQNPAKQAEVALVLIGSKGAGKGTLVRCLQRIFGAHAFQVTSREEVIGKFNGHLQDCILFVADEAYWGGDKRCVGRLQGMITEPTLPIERKGIDVIQVKNFLHVVMLAEPGWVIPAGRHERRYAALAVSDAARGDREYFKALHRQIEEDGAEAMMFDLQGMDLEDWHPREIPEALLKGSALQKQQGHTLPPLEQWYLGLLHNGVLPGAIAAKPNKAFTQSLLDDARSKFPRLRFDLSDAGLRNFLVDEESLGIACTKYRSATANGWSFPPLGECREAFDKLYGPISWDHPEVLEWGKKG